MRRIRTILLIILILFGITNFTVDSNDIHSELLGLRDNDSLYFTITRISDPTFIGEADVIHVKRQGTKYNIHFFSIQSDQNDETKTLSFSQYKELVAKIEKKDHGLTCDRYKFYFSNEKTITLSTVTYCKDSLMNYFYRQP